MQLPRVCAVLLILGLSFLVVSSSAEEAPQVRYDNYQVIRLSIANHTAYERAFAAADKLLLDVWAANAIEQWMDVMIPPAHAESLEQIFTGIPYTVRIPNVQAELDVSAQEVEQQSQKRQADFFSNFQTRPVINNWLQQQVLAHPNDAVVYSIGNSHLGNPINAIHLFKEDIQKQVIVLQCGIHAREWIAPSTCLWIIDQILNHEDRSHAVFKFEWVIVPVLNVDGYDYTRTDRLWRKNRQPNAGSTCIGTDPNRNYGFRWGGAGASGSPCSETYYGSAAWSTPVTKGIQSLIESRLGNDEVIAFFDIHSYGAYWVSPWGYTCVDRPVDYTRQVTVATAASNAAYAVNNRRYATGPSCNVIYQTSGSAPDYAYGGNGIVYAYTVEAFGSNFTPPVSWIGPVGREIYAGLKATAAALANTRNENVVQEQQ